jgi:hypothetical protein
VRANTQQEEKVHPISKLKLTGEFAAEEEPAVAVDVLQRDDALCGVSCGSCNARAAVVARPDRVAQEGLIKSDRGVIKSSREVPSEDGVSGPGAGPLRAGVSDIALG